MPAPVSREPKLTGDDIIAEILRNAAEGQFKVRYTVIVPYLYRVYLHTEDYEQIRPVISHLVQEARQALQEDLEQRNTEAAGPALLSRLGLGRKPETEFKRLAADWVIEFEPDLEERLARGEIEIYSELAETRVPEFGVGTSTRRISRPGATPVAVADPAPPTSADFPENVGEETRPASRLYARIRYEDAQGEHIFEMTKDLIVIGRGGRTYWVDLKLDAPTDVSREHCRLRRDPGTGRFYLKDVSQFGTTINGERVPSSVSVTDGEERDLEREVLLPAQAQIGLADVVTLEFHALE